MRRTVVYVDGFNLYHAIHDLGEPYLKWLNLRALGERLLPPGEVLVRTKYFSAYATWLEEPYARHRLYTAALSAVGVQLIMGKFKDKPRKCPSCEHRWTGHEEKETDVQIAIHMLYDALNDSVDRIILVSADTDLAPPIKMIKKVRPQVEVFVAAPPRRFKNCRALGPKLELTKGLLDKCRFPDKVQIAAAAYIDVPDQYRR